MMNICNKYGFDIFIISGSYGGHRRHTMYDGQRTGYMYKLLTGELKRTLNMELWTFNTEHIQESETNWKIDIRWSDRIIIIIDIIIIITIIIISIIINVNIIIIIVIIREDKFSLCECVCLEKKIFKGLHQIFYVQIVFGLYFANNVGDATIWTKFEFHYNFNKL